MDDIQLKLKRFDEELRQRDFHKKIISTAPLLFAATGLIAGIIIQNAFSISVHVWFILLAAFAAAAVFCFVIHFFYQTKINPVYVTAHLAAVCFVCIGAIRLITYCYGGANDIRNFVADEPKLATIRGTIITEPYISDNKQWAFARFAYGDPGSSFYLKITEAQGENGWAKVDGTILVHVGEPVMDLKAADNVQIYCRLERPSSAGNPGQFDVAKYLARKNVFVTATVNSRKAVKVLQSDTDTDFLIKIKRKARQIAVQSLLGGPYPQDESERLLQALVLGYRTDMGNDTYEAFRKTGLLHFVCLSGMNFGILIGMIWWLCKAAGLIKRARAAVCIIAAGMFILVIPSNPPAFRAAIICLVFCLSFFCRRKPNHFNSLAFSAVILLMIKPTDLFEVSWQLSFAAVLGILLFTDRIHFFLYEKIISYSRFEQKIKTKAFARIIARPGPILLNLFSVSLAAWLSSAGILVYNFYTIQPLTSIWTIIASPFIAVISFVGYLKLLIGLVLPTAAAALNVIIKPLSSWLIELVKYIAQRDISQVLVGHVTVWLVIFYYCVILFRAFINFKNPFVKKIIYITMILAIAFFIGATKWQRTYRDNLIVTCLDVGHGQAILAQLPGKANVLFDAGSLYVSDVGRRVVNTFLDYSGISKIDAIVISHGDIDHINGIPEIVEHNKIDGNSVYASKVFVGSEPNRPAGYLKKLLGEKEFAVQSLGEELSMDSKAIVRILWPNEDVGSYGNLSDNDKSLVVSIEFAGRKILLTSDIGKIAQREFVQLYPELKPEVVVVPHHGSVSTSDTNFLKNLDSNVLIYSCSQRNYEKQKLNKEKESFYTARDGAIKVCVEKNGEIKTSKFRIEKE